MDSKSALVELDAILNEMMQSPLGRRKFLAGLPLLLAACATGDKNRYREGDNSGQETRLTVDDEKRMALQSLPEIKKDYPLLWDAEVQAYVSRIGNKLVAANGLANNPYTYNFSVVNVPSVNAFALPAGTIFVTAPLLQMTESEAELAGVIGHEIGHVKARHAAERLDRAEKASSQSWFYALGGGALGAAAGFGVGKLMCPPKDDKCLQTAVGLGAAAGIGGGLLVNKYKFMANSREDEMEADRIGFRASVKAGYAPAHVGAFYNKLQKMEERHKQGGAALMSSIQDAMSTHPPSEERVVQMSELVSGSSKSSKSVVSTKEFDRARKKVETLLKARPKV